MKNPKIYFAKGPIKLIMKLLKRRAITLYPLGIVYRDQFMYAGREIYLKAHELAHWEFFANEGFFKGYALYFKESILVMLGIVAVNKYELKAHNACQDAYKEYMDA